MRAEEASVSETTGGMFGRKSRNPNLGSFMYYVCQQKDWVGGLKKWQFLITFSTVFMLTENEKVRKCQKVCLCNIWMVPNL